MQEANVFIYDKLAGVLIETDTGYSFRYDEKYLQTPDAEAISLTLPLRAEIFTSAVLFPFFDGLIPEGWLLDIAERNWKINTRDRMSLLLHCCADCIGNVSVKPKEDER